MITATEAEMNQTDARSIDFIMPSLVDEKDHETFFICLASDLPDLKASVIGQIFSQKHANGLLKYGSLFGAAMDELCDSASDASEMTRVRYLRGLAVLSQAQSVTTGRVPWVYILGHRVALKISKWLGNSNWLEQSDAARKERIITIGHISCRLLEDYFSPEETIMLEIERGTPQAIITTTPSNGLSLLGPMLPSTNLTEVVKQGKTLWSKRAQYIQNSWKSDSRKTFHRSKARSVAAQWKPDFAGVQLMLVSTLIDALIQNLPFDNEQFGRIQALTRRIFHHLASYCADDDQILTMLVSSILVRKPGIETLMFVVFRGFYPLKESGKVDLTSQCERVVKKLRSYQQLTNTAHISGAVIAMLTSILLNPELADNTRGPHS